MRTFAFLIHPINTAQLKNFQPLSARIIPKFIQGVFFKSKLPLRIVKIKKIQSSQGEEIEGYLLVSRLLCENISEAMFLDEIIEAGRAAKKLGARILGFDDCAVLSADNIYQAKNKLKMPLTSGSAFTAWSAFEAVYKIAKLKKVDLRSSTLAVIGATNAAGALCAKKLSAWAPKINLHGIDEAKLERLKESILALGGSAQVNTSLSILKTIEDAKIIIFSEGLPQPGLSPEGINKNAIVADISAGRRIAQRLSRRRDITTIDSGWIRLPHPAKFGINFGLTDEIIPAALAETMLLTFEGKFINYSLGENVNPDKLEEIADIAVQRGFEVWLPQAESLQK